MDTIKNKCDEKERGQEGQNEEKEERARKNTGKVGHKGTKKGRQVGKSATDAESDASMPTDSLAQNRTTSVASDESRAPSPAFAEPIARKRPRSNGRKTQQESGQSSSESDVQAGTARSTVPSAKRGRGRTAPYRKEEPRPPVEDEVAGLVAKMRKQPLALPSVELGDLDTEALSERADNAADVILTVATRSGNLKGTYVRALKDAAASFKSITLALRERTISDETASLRAANVKLKAELSALQSEFAAMRTELARPAPPAISEDERRALLLELGGMLDAKLAGIEDRLLPEKRLRPPLSKAAPTAAAVVSANASAKGKGKGRGKSSASTFSTSVVAAPVASSQSPPSAADPLVEVEWIEVAKRSKGRAAKAALPAPVLPAARPSTTAPKKPAKKKERKLRPPRSAAVVLSLQPGAEEQGTTYATVLRQAKERICISELGIPALKVRKTATGARILEVPGATSGHKADLLAQKLKEVLPADSVRVARPEKWADMRISGLDDSVTVSEVVAAVTRVGGCEADVVKAGEIHYTPSGQGTLFVRCPIVAVKKVAASRLLVGWVSAQVQILPARPMRCFRCHELGHVRLQCTSEVDRSDECFRCGQKGHKSAGCSANPHCSICAAASQPANHRVGAPSCKGAQKQRRKAASNTVTVSAAVTTAALAPSTSCAAPEEAMVTA